MTDHQFMAEALIHICGISPHSGKKILDIGCGQGELVTFLRNAGFEAYGTDLVQSLPPHNTDYFVPIKAVTGVNDSVSYQVIDTYELPFEDCSFEAVISTSVLEHVIDKYSFFKEIHRVLNTGGMTMHLLPGKHYMPHEPHLYVPLIPTLWPKVPKWWLAFWALIGIRNEFQKGEHWKIVYKKNLDYCRDGLDYWSIKKYIVYLQPIFKTVSCNFDFYVEYAPGGYSKLVKLMRLNKSSNLLKSVLRELRMTIISARK